MSTIEHLTEADHASVRCLLLEAHADYARGTWAKASAAAISEFQARLR